MSFNERSQYASFRYNKDFIESRWSRQWGDRINELVFIGPDIDKEKILPTWGLPNPLIRSGFTPGVRKVAPVWAGFPTDVTYRRAVE